MSQKEIGLLRVSVNLRIMKGGKVGDVDSDGDDGHGHLASIVRRNRQ